MEDKYEEVVQWEVEHISVEDLRDFYMRTKKAYYEMFPESFTHMEELYLQSLKEVDDIMKNDTMGNSSFANISRTLGLDDVMNRYGENQDDGL